MFSISDIHKLTRLPLRRLQYVIEKELGPIQELELDETHPGNARFYSESGATMIVCAAKLLEAGIRRDAVRAFLWNFYKVPSQRKVRSNLDYFFSALDFESKNDFRVFMADSTHIRCVAGEKDSQWLRVEDEALVSDPNYIPTVTIMVNLRVIREIFNKSEN